MASKQELLRIIRKQRQKIKELEMGHESRAPGDANIKASQVFLWIRGLEGLAGHSTPETDARIKEEIDSWMDNA